jgi:hypothetical protein
MTTTTPTRNEARPERPDPEDMLTLTYQGEPADLATLLQAGFRLEALVGCTLREFLCIEMEICGDYANKRIQTIFIDGKAVDDFDTAHVVVGTSLALSGAMPGLVGAVMRRGGTLGGLRDSITYRHLDELRADNVQGVVAIRLYNFIAEELAHIFLRRGIMVEPAKVRAFLARRPDVRSGLRLGLPPGKPEELSQAELETLLDPVRTVFIKAPAQQA